MPIPRTQPPWRLLMALGVPVLLGHVWVIDTFRALMQPPSQLTEMATPMYTRVLLPQDAPPTSVLAPLAPAAPQPPATSPPSATFIEPNPAQDAAPKPLQAASQAKPPPTPPKPKPDAKAKANPPTPDADLDAASAQPVAPERPDADLPTESPSLADKAGASAAHPASSPEQDVPQVNAQALAADPASPITAPQLNTASSPEPLPHAAGTSVAQASPGASATATSAGPPADTASAATPQAGDSAADSAGWPPDTRLNYRLGGHYRGELHGTARVSWQKKDGNYQAQVDLDIGFLFSMKLTSQGQFSQHHLLPQVYEEQVRKTRRRITLAGDSVQLNNGKRLPRPAQVQDTASQFIELSHRFANGQQPLQVGQQVHFPLARPNRLARWTYEVVEETELNLPQLGPTRAFLLKPRPSDPTEAADSDRKGVNAQMWLAPSLSHLPVRILLTMGEDTQVDLMLERIEQSGQ